MTSEKQILANQRNAQHSTGPRTAVGKANTRLNAVRHGLTGQTILVAPGERAAFIAFSQPLTASLNPMGPQELHLAARIVADTWRLHRAAANEENIFALGLLDPDHTPDSTIIATDDCADLALAVAVSQAQTYFNRTRDFDRLSLYEQRLNRTLHKNYALLRELQAERNRQETQEVPPARRRRSAASFICPGPGEPRKNGLVFADSFADTVTWVDGERIVLEKGVPNPHFFENLPPDCWQAC